MKYFIKMILQMPRRKSVNYVCVLPPFNALALVISYICTPGYCVYTSVKNDTNTCGSVRTNTETVSEGPADIEMYPWMGLLLYPFGADNMEDIKKTSVILITKKLALVPATELDQFPKHDFRKKSRVVIGRNCSIGPYIRVLQYSYHPDFASQRYSTVALIQLQSTGEQDLMPICAPVTNVEGAAMYALIPTHDCMHSMLNVYKMKYVDDKLCRHYYELSTNDMHDMWPRYVKCAQGNHKNHCIWKSGTALVTKQKGKWHLLGIGVDGPGCDTPTRFFHYNEYFSWVVETLNRIGRVAITRISKSSLIVRKSGSTLQRYGPCDSEETAINIYTDKINIPSPTEPVGSAVYNLTLYSKLDYSCILLRTSYTSGVVPYQSIASSPEIKIQYHISCYGKPVKTINAQQLLWWINQQKIGPAMAWPVPWLKPHEYIDQPPYPPSESNAYPHYPPS